jgi:CO/xanthine dehydrogenase FAD-binding subunit
MDAYVPFTLAEALDARLAHPEATPVAGGTDLMVDVNARRFRPLALLDLSHVAELGSWHRNSGTVVIGSGLTFTRIVEELPELTALTDAAGMVGSRPIRNRGTIGGNLATASPSGDLLPVLAAWDGRVLVVSLRWGRRAVPWSEFLVGPKQTSLAEDELIAGIELEPPHGHGSFAKVGPRGAMVIAIAGVCVQLDETARWVHVALGSVGPTVLRPEPAEAFGAAVVPWQDPQAVVPDEQLREFGRLAAAGARPIDDHRGSAAYRRHAVEVLARRALGRALQERRERPW